MFVNIPKELEEPWLKELILRDDATYEFTDNDLESVKNNFIVKNGERKEKLLKEHTKELIKVRFRHGFNMVPVNIEDPSVEGIARDCLFHPTAVIASERGLSSLLLYSEALSYEWQFNSGYYVHHNKLGPFEPVSKEILDIAGILHRTIIPDVRSMDDLKGKFLCMRCPPPVRRMMHWKDLVSHLDTDT